MCDVLGVCVCVCVCVSHFFALSSCLLIMMTLGEDVVTVGTRPKQINKHTCNQDNKINKQTDVPMVCELANTLQLRIELSDTSDSSIAMKVWLPLAPIQVALNSSQRLGTGRGVEFHESSSPSSFLRPS